jgi:hypothetical protein
MRSRLGPRVKAEDGDRDMSNASWHGNRVYVRYVICTGVLETHQSNTEGATEIPDGSGKDDRSAANIDPYDA